MSESLYRSTISPNAASSPSRTCCISASSVICCDERAETKKVPIWTAAAKPPLSTAAAEPPRGRRLSPPLWESGSSRCRSPKALLSGVLQLLDPAHDIPVIRIHPVHLQECFLGVVGVADFLVAGAEVVEQADVLLLGDLRHFDAFAVPLDRQLGHAFLEKAEAEHRRAFDGALRILRGQLELADGLIDEAHLLVGDAEVVVGVVVFTVELLLDAFLELLEDLLERLLFLRQRDRLLVFRELRLQLRGQIEEVVLVGEEILFFHERRRHQRRRDRKSVV